MILRGNGRNIVGQQLQTLLLDVNMLRPFAHRHPVACCCGKFEIGQTLSYMQTNTATPNDEQKKIIFRSFHAWVT